jgi:16S rRNA (cytidine1402-2'-O)-methyltransferase
MKKTAQAPRPVSATLYVVATPIGNLEDITLRALRTLRGVEFIAAENVRHTRNLCRHFAIKARLVAYNQNNRKRNGPRLIQRLKSGSDIALVSDAGTPGISDPGYHLIQAALAEGIAVMPIPGPSAVITVLSVSGLPTDRFLFLGFLSSKTGRRKRELGKLTPLPYTLVLYEAPHRIVGLLRDLKEVLGDRSIALGREVTKVFEEIKRGTVTEVLTQLEPDKIKGEMTLVVAGNVERDAEGEIGEQTLKTIDLLMKERSMSLKDIAREVAKREGLPYRQIYRVCLDRKKVLDVCIEENAL